MRSRAQNIILPVALSSLAAAALLVAGCSSGGSTNSSLTTSPTQAPAFVIGTDAPMASVVSFSAQVMSIDAINSTTGASVSLISGQPVVDFARFNGLQTLLDMNDVDAGTYDTVQITLGPATIGYLNTSGGGAPTITTETATLTQSMVSVTLTKPLVVATEGPVGLRVDFDLRKSIEVQNGAITGSVNPTFDVSAVGTGDAGGYCDTFIAGVTSVNSDGQSFTVQGPHGEQFTIDVNGQTEWDNGESISSLVANQSIVEVSGALDKTDQTLDADEVAILSQNGFYAGGQITYVTTPNPGGAASSFDLYVRGLLPTGTGLTLGQIAQVNLSGNENYFIYWWHNKLTNFVFNQDLLLAGQHVSVGGPASGATNSQAVTVKRVVLRNWGFNGTVTSVDSANGTFQMTINGFAGLLIPQTVTVYGAPMTAFRNGFTEMSDVTVNANVRVVGLLLKDPTSGDTALLAHYVDELD